MANPQTPHRARLLPPRAPPWDGGTGRAVAWAVAVMLVLAVGSLVYRGRILTGKIEDMEETAKL